MIINRCIFDVYSKSGIRIFRTALVFELYGKKKVKITITKHKF